MLYIVVGWVRNLLGPSRVEVVEEICVTVTKSQLGITFQKDQFKLLFEAIHDWPSIEFFDAYENPITSLEDVSEGPDGGIDAIIRITTRTERGAKNVANRIRNKIVTRNY